MIAIIQIPDPQEVQMLTDGLVDIYLKTEHGFLLRFKIINSFREGEVKASFMSVFEKLLQGKEVSHMKLDGSCGSTTDIFSCLFLSGVAFCAVVLSTEMLT